MQFYFILSLVASIIVVIFAIMNAAPVPVNIFFLKYELSLALIIFISAALGAVISVLFGLVKQFKLQRKIKVLSTDIQDLDKEKQILQRDISILQSVKPAEEEHKNIEETQQTENQETVYSTTKE